MLVRGRETREGLMLDDTANPIELDTEKGFISSLGAFHCPEYADRFVVQLNAKDNPLPVVRWQSRRGNEFLCFYL